MPDIIRFSGDHLFLSNFYTWRVNHDNHTWPSAEHAYQAAKTLSPEEKRYILHARTPGEAKRRGRMATLRDDWEDVKDSVMMEILESKFSRSQGMLARHLLETGRGLLVEGNTWHDNYWGVCYCNNCPGHGKNRLGRTLMAVRRSLRSDA